MVTQALIEKYLTGEATDAEEEIVLAYLADEQADTFLLKDLLESFDGDLSPAIGNYEERDQLLKQLRMKLYPAILEKKKASNPALPWVKRAVVACIALLITVTALYYFFLRPPGNIAEPALLVWQEYQNTTDTTQFIQLPDHSGLWLKPHSSVKYQQGMASLPQRTIQLEGTGYFDISQQANAPFVVQAGALKTEVLGTAFQIESYPSARIFRLALISGKVQIRDTGDAHTKPVQVRPDQQLTYKPEQRQWQTDTLNCHDAALYKSDALVFNNILLKDALQSIAIRFGYTLKIDPAVNLTGKHISGVYQQHKAEELLELILFVSQYRFRIQSGLLEILP